MEAPQEPVIVDFSPLKSMDEWRRYITNQHGSDVATVTEEEINVAITERRSVRVEDVLRNLLQKTREIDVAKTGIVARFPY